MGGGGGGGNIPLDFTSEEESSVEQNSSQSSSPSLCSFSLQRLPEENEDGTVDGECGSVFEGFRIPSSFLELQANQKGSTACREVLLSYDQLEERSESLDEGKSKILSYTPGGWMENVIGMKLSDYDVPNTTILLLIGPKGSGKSSLVNRISKVFEDDKFASERAQVSYNPSVGDGTYFLQEYMIPRGSTSFCLYDTRGLSYDSSDNVKMLKSWITEGVHPRKLIIRPSDNSHLRNRMKCKARGNGCQSKETRMVNFVIFVVNGLAVLKSMDNAVGEGTKYTEMIATTFDCPYLSFNDDKPVVVVTHGDLLALNDRARVRVHLGELLGIHPAKQIFDIPESNDPVTELTIVSMLHYSLEHADKNLSVKGRIAEKVRCPDSDKCWQIHRVRRVCLSTYASLFIILAIAIISIYITPLLIHHPTKSEALLDPPILGAVVDGDPPKLKAHNRLRKSKAHVDPPILAVVDVDPPNSNPHADPPIAKVHKGLCKSKAHVDPPLLKAVVDVDPANSKPHADPPKAKAHNRPRKSKAQVDPPKAKAHNRPRKSKAQVDPPKSEGVASSHQSEDLIINRHARMRLWLE